MQLDCVPKGNLQAVERDAGESEELKEDDKNLQDKDRPDEKPT